jgi:hypothetical protein
MAKQRVTVAPGEGVVRIVNVDGPGEREKVDTFMERHGLARDRCAWDSCSQVVPIILAGCVP